MTADTTRPKQTPLRDIIAYATGDGASSLIMNSIFGFSLLYFTKALGLDPKLAGIAMAAATLWDAITDPVMGHITDNTRSRFGRRHPYMLLGGIVSVFCCYAIWAVPLSMRTPDLRIISSSDDNTLKLWNAETGEEVNNLEGQSAAVSCMALSPDSKWIVTGNEDNALTLWDAKGGKVERRFEGHDGIVYSVAFSPDAKQIVSASQDQTVKLWDAKTGEEVRSFEGHTDSVLSVAFSPDGESIISASQDKTLKLWKVEDGKVLHSLEGHKAGVLSAAFSPLGTWIVSGSEDKTLRVWDAKSGKEEKILKGHKGGVVSVSYSTIKPWILSGSEDGTLKVWDAESGEELQTLEGHDTSVSYAAFSRDGERIVSWAKDNTLMLWGIETWQPLQSTQLPDAFGPVILQSAAKPMLFWYLLVVNLLLRTALTVFLVSHGALGFEVCTDYNQRSTLQGVRGGLNMAVNLVSTIAIWTVFLRDRGEIDGTAVASHYQHMGLAFCIATLLFVLFVVFATRKYAVDTRGRSEIGGNHLGQVLRNLKDVLFDPYPRTIFMFVGIVFIGIVIVTSCQMFIYVDFMKFGPWEKTIVHGSTMIGAAAGALLVSKMVRRFDKKPAVYIGMTAGVIGNLILVAIFYTGLIEPGLTWGVIPVAMLVFLAFHPIYHTGATMATTVGMSMMADVSEICRHRTGVLKDGTYSAMISFVQKAGISFGLLVNGYCLDWIGYVEGAGQQSQEVARRLLLIGFVGGTIVGLAAMFCIAWYPVTRAYMNEIKAALADKGESTQ